jgi:hypothetical protein
MVAGFNNPRAFDSNGKLLADIALAGGTVASLDASGDERRLLALDLNRSLAWIDTETWTIIDRWEGPWLCASLSKSAPIAAAVSFDGKLLFACLHDDRFQMIGESTIEGGVNAIALNGDAIALARADDVQLGRVSLGCPHTAVGASA